MDPQIQQHAIQAIIQRNKQAALSLANQDNSIASTPQQFHDPAALSQAMAILNPNGSDNMSQIGKAIKTPNYAGYCLQWVDDQTGNANRLPTAYADYQANASTNNINTSTDNIPKGARVYFAPDSSNGNMGHVGLSNGDGTFTSATDNGIQTFDIASWEKYSGQSYLGYANPQKTS